MENNIKVKENNKRAFNNGYLIGRYREDIAEIIQVNFKKNSLQNETIQLFYQGISQGRSDMSFEKSKIDLADIKRIRSRNEQERDLDRDLD